MSDTMRVPALTIVLLAILGITAATKSAAQVVVDPLKVGLTVTGTADLSREKEDSTFLIQMNDRSVMLLVLNGYAFSAQPNTSMSYRWAQQLMQAGSVSLQVGEVPDELRAAPSVRKDLNEMLACFVAPGDRKGNELAYGLRCTAYDTARQVKEDGRLLVEIVVMVVVPAGSAGDAFLGKPRQENSLVFVRLAPGVP